MVFKNDTTDKLIKGSLMPTYFFITKYVHHLPKAYQYPHYLHSFNKTKHNI